MAVHGPIADGPDGSRRAEAWRDAVGRLAAARRVLLVLHVRPDGDSIGCSLALAHGLTALGKGVAVVCPDPVPPHLRFLDPQGLCGAPDRADGSFDVALFLDCADLERIGTARPLLARAACVVNLDHHPSNTRFGHINYVDPGAAACGEIAYELLRGLRAPIDAATASALYAAIATDTGSFRFENTTARSLSLAAGLVELGADAGMIGREVWGSRSLASLRLLQAALGTLGLDDDGRVAWLSLTPSLLRRSGAEPGDAEGLVDYPRALQGVEVAILFTLDETRRVRVSMRSRASVDVSRLAGLFGGGGHARAAGCTLRGSLRSVRQRVLAAAREAVAASAPGDGARGAGRSGPP